MRENYVPNLNTALKYFTPFNGDSNFLIIFHIINFITLPDAEYNNAYLNTSIATVNQELMKLHPNKQMTPKFKNCTKSYWSQTC